MVQGTGNATGGHEMCSICALELEEKTVFPSLGRRSNKCRALTRSQLSSQLLQLSFFHVSFPPAGMKFRTRDAAAALLSVILGKIAWTDSTGPESLTVSTVLSFYYEATPSVTVEHDVHPDDDAYYDDDDDDVVDDDDAFNDEDDDAAIQRRRNAKKKKREAGGDTHTVRHRVRTAPPVPLDVDGDGTVEGLVVPAVVDDATGAWGLKVLDLKPLHGRRGAAAELTAYPFHPAVMFTSPAVEAANANANASSNAAGSGSTASPPVPIKMASGQVLFRNGIHPTADGSGSGSGYSSQYKPAGRFVESDDKARHYFCGTGWGDAAERCGTPCPDASSTGCPAGETCYADTPCDSQLSQSQSQHSEHSEHSAAKSSTADDDLLDDDVAAVEKATHLILTPRHGLPSVATLWSDGSVTMHSLTGDYVPGETHHGGRGRGKRDQKKQKKEADITKKSRTAAETTLLELRPMWRTNPFQPAPPDGSSSAGGDSDGEPQKQERLLPPSDILEFDEIDLTIDTTAPVGEHGAILVAARYTRKDRAGRLRAATSYHAIDAFSGRMIWSHGDREGRGKLGAGALMGDASALAADSGGGHGHDDISTSSARRRSFLPGAKSAAAPLLGSLGVNDDVTASEDCMDSFRRWVLDPETGVLPHVSWASGRDDARIHVAHFDRKHQGQGSTRKNGGSKGRRGGKTMGWQKSMLSVSRRAKAGATDKKGATKLESVRPNVVLFRNREGVSALSLRNGRPVCHLSLLDNSLYADINMDGVIEQVQVITQPSGQRSSDVKPNVGAKAGEDASQTFVSDLVNRAIKSQARGRGGAGGGGGAMRSPLCHVLVLSGIPAREEVFSANLCSNRKGSMIPAKNAFSTAPPLAVPGLNHRGVDLVFALNSRQVSRYDPSGNEVWTTLSDRAPLPSWSAMTTHSPASMQQIDFPAVTRGAASPAVRPILVAGEDGASILSAGR